jgi:hypothetical protein
VDYLSAPDRGSHIDRLVWLVQWKSLFQGLVEPMLVVMPRILGRGLPEMSFTVEKRWLGYSRRSVPAIVPRRIHPGDLGR